MRDLHHFFSTIAIDINVANISSYLYNANFTQDAETQTKYIKSMKNSFDLIFDELVTMRQPTGNNIEFKVDIGTAQKFNISICLTVSRENEHKGTLAVTKTSRQRLFRSSEGENYDFEVDEVTFSKDFESISFAQNNSSTPFR